jgi:predicted site-specific integrase-resolvase
MLYINKGQKKVIKTITGKRKTVYAVYDNGHKQNGKDAFYAWRSTADFKGDLVKYGKAISKP